METSIQYQGFIGWQRRKNWLARLEYKFRKTLKLIAQFNRRDLARLLILFIPK
jgi:hypothetical protein